MKQRATISLAQLSVLLALLFAASCSSDASNDEAGPSLFIRHELPLPTAAPLSTIDKAGWIETEFASFSVDGRRYSISYPSDWSLTQADGSTLARVTPPDDSSAMAVTVRAFGFLGDFFNAPDAVTAESQGRLVDLQGQLDEFRVIEAVRLDANGVDSILARYRYQESDGPETEVIEVHTAPDTMVVAGTYPANTPTSEKLLAEAIVRSFTRVSAR